MSRRWLSFGLVGCSVFASVSASAEILDKPADIIRVIGSGRSGAWMDTSSLKKCLYASKAEENLNLQLRAIVEQREMLSRDVKTLEEAIDAANLQTGLWKRQALAKDVEVVDLTSDLQSWYRNPIVMTVIGVTIGALAATSILITRN